MHGAALEYAAVFSCFYFSVKREARLSTESEEGEGVVGKQCRVSGRHRGPLEVVGCEF